MVVFQDRSKLTPSQVDYVVQLRELYLEKRKNPSKHIKDKMTLQDMERQLNNKFGLDKSIRAYRRAWESKGVN